MAPDAKASVVKHRTRSGFHPHAPSSSSAKRAKTGFKVGPSHAPDGAYLGRAKRIKADLIEKAKTKKRYYKEFGTQAKAPRENVGSPEDGFGQRDEGRFAPETASSSAGPRGRSVQDSRLDYLMELETQRQQQAQQKRRSIVATKNEQRGMSHGEKRQAERLRAAELQAQRRIQGGTALLAREAADKEDKNDTGNGVGASHESKEGQKRRHANGIDQSSKSEQERQAVRQRRTEQWHAKSGSRTGRQRGQPNLGARMDLLLDKIQRG